MKCEGDCEGEEMRADNGAGRWRRGEGRGKIEWR